MADEGNGNGNDDGDDAPDQNYEPGDVPDTSPTGEEGVAESDDPTTDSP